MNSTPAVGPHGLNVQPPGLYARPVHRRSIRRPSRRWPARPVTDVQHPHDPGARVDLKDNPINVRLFAEKQVTQRRILWRRRASFRMLVEAQDRRLASSLQSDLLGRIDRRGRRKSGRTLPGIRLAKPASGRIPRHAWDGPLRFSGRDPTYSFRYTHAWNGWRRAPRPLTSNVERSSPGEMRRRSTESQMPF